MTITAFDLPTERPGHPAPAELAGQRRALAGAIANGIWRTDPPPRELTLGAVRVLRFDPPGPVRAHVLHFHGGAFRIGAPEVVAPFAAALAARSGVSVTCVNYRLAPEHPFPAGLRDGLAVIEAFERAGLPLFLSGDSAGGGLATSLTALATAQGYRLEGLILLSPWLDLTVTSASYHANADTDPVFSKVAATTAAQLYLQGAAAEHPLASPLFGSVAAFPPTLINAGSGEVLVADSERLHAKLSAAGIKATLSLIPGMEHVAITRSFALPGADETFAAVTAFIDTVLAPHA